MNKLKHLFQPIKIGTMNVKNRLVMPPMGVHFGVDEEGNCTEQLWEYLAARAKGGTGMILIGGAAVDPSGIEGHNLPRLWDDKFIPALKKTAAAVHRYNAKIGIQLLHAGAQSQYSNKVAPSAVPSLSMVTGIPRALTIKEIKEIVEAFGEAALRCREADFDFIELHAAHGYLVSGFLSPRSNLREDEYGGSFENRIRLPLEIIRKMNERTGGEYPIGIRVNGDDYVDGGWILEDTKRFAPILEKEGVAYLHVSAGVYGANVLSVPSMYVEQGCFTHLAEQVKKEVSIPIITVGRIKRPEFADQVIKEGKADMVAMGRAHLADPDIANKAKSGDFNDIRPCVGCCLGCIGNVQKGQAASCVINPEVNREYILKNQKSVSRPKKVLVVGSGPAGLAVARMAAVKGHKVVMCDQNGHIGGMLSVAALPPGRFELMELIRYFERELNKLGVEIRLNIDLNQELIESINPDTVVLATGSLPEIPQIEGLLDNEMDVHTVVDVLRRDSVVNGRVIILGGSQAALEAADFLSEMGKKAIVLNRGQHYAEEMASNDRYYLRERLKRNDIRLYKNVTIKKFLPKGVFFTSGEGEIRLEDFSDIVIADGMRSNKEATNLFQNLNIGVHVVGDAKSPRTLLESIGEADELGRSI